MSDDIKKVNKQSTKPKQAVDEDVDVGELSEKLDSVYRLYTGLHDKLDSLITEVEMTNNVARIMIELLGGISPGRKNLGNIELVKLRNEGVKIKDLAKMQGISECAMSRQLKELREVGILHDQEREND